MFLPVYRSHFSKNKIPMAHGFSGSALLYVVATPSTVVLAMKEQVPSGTMNSNGEILSSCVLTVMELVGMGLVSRLAGAPAPYSRWNSLLVN